MDKRLSEKIKIVSFFSILLVIFLHSFNLDSGPNPDSVLFNKSSVWFIEDLISFGFTRIAVPLFFILSGFLFFYNHNVGDPLFNKIKKRFRTLLIPFLFWSLFGIAFYFVLQSIPQTAVFFTKERVIDFSFQKWLLKIFVNPIPYQLWFIRDLMLIVLISPLLQFCLQRFGKLTLLFAFILWIAVCGEFQNSSEAFLFFLTGSFLSIYNPKALEIDYENKALYIFCLWVILVLLKTTLLYFDIEPLIIKSIFKISILIGVIAFWGIYDSLFKKANAKNILLQIAGFTFFIYAAHEPMLTVFKKILFVVFGKDHANAYFMVYLVTPILTFVCCLTTGIIFKKYFKSFYEIITGGR